MFAACITIPKIIIFGIVHTIKHGEAHLKHRSLHLSRSKALTLHVNKKPLKNEADIFDLSDFFIPF